MPPRRGHKAKPYFSGIVIYGHPDAALLHLFGGSG
jgi:hypothetical protein